jgi:hypothetical protein
MDFSHVTIVNVDGRHGECSGAQLSLAHSARELPGAQAILFSPRRPAKLLEGIQHVAIQPLSYFEYGLFIIYALHKLIRTEFVLIVQEDGWVLDGRNWRDDFFNYDYIGAPIHFARVCTGGAVEYLKHFAWVPLHHGSGVRIEFVMNGGFSLRSKKLLAAPSALSLPYLLPAVTEVRGPPYAMHWASHSNLEDVQLCIDMRSSLEQSGLIFAPLSIAKTFAFEHLHPELHAGLDLTQVLGHHCTIRKLSSTEPLSVDYQVNRREFSTIFGESAVAELFRKRGYKVRLG